ncbi:MAG: hypothetical protein QXY45_02595 [Candidatus Aenigmatarchaeota archaeon]
MVIEDDDREYELIPLSPIRRLERRLEKLENNIGGGMGNLSKELLSDVVDIVRMNQMLVDELAKSNDALRIELSKLPARLDELITNMKELVSFIKASGEQEVTGLSQDVMKPVVEKLDELVKTNKQITSKNDAMLELLDEVGKRLRRPAMPRPIPQIQQPQMPQKRIQPLNL